ncbi:MAG: hypothetical protein Q4G08_01995 [Capnocytophaga sp.]|nr:hypothetical protein [Capnocytophaga sp.]
MYRIKNILLLCVSIGVLVSCSQKEKAIVRGTLFLPEDSKIIFQINQKNNFLSAADNNLFWKENSPKTIPANAAKVLKSLPDYMPVWIAFSQKDIYITTKANIDSTTLWNRASAEIQTAKIGNYDWKYFLAGEQLVISTSDSIEFFTERSFAENHPLLTKLITSSDRNSIANVYMNKPSANAFFSPMFKADVTQSFQDWLAFDVFLDDNNIRLSGTAFVAPGDNDVMQHTQPYQTDTARWLPADADAVTSYTFADASSLFTSDTLNLPLLPLLNGITFAQSPVGHFATLSSYDGLESVRLLPILSEDILPQYNLYELADEPSLFSFMALFHSSLKPRWIGRIDNMLYLSESKEIVQKIIEQVVQQRTLALNASYGELEKEMASAVSITRIVNLNNNAEYRRAHPAIAKAYRWTTLQLTPQNDYYIFTFISKKQSETSADDSLHQRFVYRLDANIITPPTIVLNHRSKRKEVVIQDENFDLHLIGNNGSLLWKKKLDGKIQSPIYQVDLFKNGYLQMAFTTENSLWVVDRNGKNVAPFPKKYKSPITPLEVTDYEGNLDYRFLFAENQKLHLLDKKGIEVGGFAHRTTEGTPHYTPKHFRTQQKDYLIYTNTDGALKILHRNGETRIPVQKKYDFSDNPPALWNNQFVLSTRSGNMLYIDLSGRLNETQDLLPEQHHFTTNKHLFVQMSDSLLSINQKKYNIPAGNYSRPKLFRLKGKNYVASLDSASNKLYLWDENGQLLQYFPTQAVTQTDMAVENEQIWMAIVLKNNELAVFSTDVLTPKP